MGDLLSKDMLFDLLINIINIVILFLVTKKLLYKPVQKIIERRRNELTAARADAENAKVRAEQAEKEYRGMLDEAESVKSDILEKAYGQAQKVGTDIINEAKARAEDIISAANEKAEDIRANAVNESKKEIAEAAVSIAGRILSRECGEEENKAIIDAYFNS